jgi:hypothetical protein
MGVNSFRDAGEPRCFSASFKNSFAVDGFPWLAAWKQPVSRTLPAPVSNQYFTERIGKHDLAILATFAAADPDHPAFAIDITDFEACQF